MQENAPFTIRDTLALERTRLANERTLLAYVRTALSLIAGGVVLLQFFSQYDAYVVVAWLLFLVGAIILLIGIGRFISVRASLGRQRRQPVSDRDAASPRE
jgi:putative membrane protein